jgi:hypothetical protein
MENEASIGIDGGLHVIRWTLWSVADSHGPGIGLAFDQRVASFGVEPGSHAVELGSPSSKCLERRSRRAWRFVGFGIVALIQTSQITSNPAV